MDQSNKKMGILVKIQLLKMKLEVLKLQSNDYEWQCNVPDKTKKELLSVLDEINKELEKDEERS